MHRANAKCGVLARLGTCTFLLPNRLMDCDQMCHSLSSYAKAGKANFVMVSTGYFSFNSSGSQFSWSFTMGYSKLKFRGDGNKAYPCFKPY